jgi:fibronectin-binding autotransporter adhesin
MKSKRTIVRSVVIGLAFVGLLAVWAGPAAQAAVYYWDTVNFTDGTPGPGDGKITGGGGLTWGTGNTKWTIDGGVNNLKWGNTLSDTAVFTDVGGSIGVNEVNAGGITFDNFSTTGYTLTPNNTLHLGGGGVIQTLPTDGNSSGAPIINTITTKLQLMGTGATTATFSSNSAKSTMQIGNNVTDTMILDANATSATLTLNGTNTGLNRFGYASGDKAMINNRAIAVVKDGPGTWWLSGKLLFTGGLTIKEGDLVFSYRDDCLGTTGITLGNSAGGAKAATLVSGSSGRNIGRPITLAGTTTGILTVAGGSGLAATTYSGGVIGPNNLTLDSRGTLLTMSTAAINNAGTLTVKGAGNTTISFGIGSSVTGLTKNDAGTLTLSVANTYSGATTVNGGKLLVNGSLAAAAGKVTVNANGTLGGTGTIARDVDVFGTLAPGASIESLDTGALSIAATGTLDNELGRNSGTPVSDIVNVTGAVTLAAGANLKLTLFTGLAQPELGDIFYLVANDGVDAVSGVFTKLDGATTMLVEGSVFGWNLQSWQITYKANYQAGGGSSFAGGNDIAIKVPEPATMGLLAIGGLALLRRRRRS